jgi:hypothetical protein
LSSGFGTLEKTAEMDRRKNQDKLGEVKKAMLEEWKIKSISLQIGHGHKQKTRKAEDQRKAD